MATQADKTGAKKFVSDYVAKKSVALSGIDWDMVAATLRESADNCFRCDNKGCPVCRMTREIAERISQQTSPAR